MNVNTGLGRDANVALRILVKDLAPLLVPLLMPFIKVLNTSTLTGTPERGRDASRSCGVRCNEPRASTLPGDNTSYILVSTTDTDLDDAQLKLKGIKTSNTE